MYHIKNDKRCRKSAAAIVAALEQLLDRKSFMDITVTDIQKTAGVGRSTFYRLFDNIDDVVTYSVDEQFKEIVKGYTDLSMRDFTAACISGMTESGGALMNILSSGRADLITRSLRKNLREAAEGQGEISEDELQYSFAVFASVCMAVVRVWDEGGRKETIDQLVDYVEKYIDLKAF
jgi:hypothetical protein